MQRGSAHRIQLREAVQWLQGGLLIGCIGGANRLQRGCRGGQHTGSSSTRQYSGFKGGCC
eukprot:1184506-Prorocentrum_minimum.AAC.1